MKNPFEKPSVEKPPVPEVGEEARGHLERMRKATHIGLFDSFLERFQEAGGRLSSTETDSLRKSAVERHMQRLEQTIKNYEQMKIPPEAKEDFQRRLEKMQKELAALKGES